MARHRQWHISGWPAVMLAPIAIPIIVLLKLGELVGLIKPTTDLTPQDVEQYFADFKEGRGGDWDWDDFTCIPITDPDLESIRQEAAALGLPLDDDGREQLTRLIGRARNLRR